MRKLEKEDLLLPQEVLLPAGVHIGARVKTKDMEPFIFQVKPDGLIVLDIRKFDERIKIAAKFISKFESPSVIVVSSQSYGEGPVRKFCEVTKCVPIVGRFLPGTFSNPAYASKLKPKLVVILDPKVDRQAVTEAVAMGIPIVAFCNTDNSLSNVDLCIPVNNKGRRSLAVAFWLLARQILRERGELKADGELSVPIDDFESKEEEVDQ